MAKAAQLAIDNDGLHAVLSVPPGLAVDLYRLRELVASHRLCVGLDREALIEATRARSSMRRLTLAHGEAPTNGADGQLEMLVDLGVSYQQRADGSLDFRDFQLFKQVERGEILARYHPATAGTDGLSVTGIAIAAKPGNDWNPATVTGAGTGLNPGDPRCRCLRLMATLVHAPVTSKPTTP
ncbi:MAG: flagellar assembly protein A [Planctomycetota bacterium]|jgi:uncharacterized protein (DUF342 family)